MMDLMRSSWGGKLDDKYRHIPILALSPFTFPFNRAVFFFSFFLFFKGGGAAAVGYFVVFLTMA